MTLTAAQMTGDLWAAVTVDLTPWSSTWAQLPPGDTWADEVGAWEDDLYGVPAPVEVTGGQLTRDVAGATARTTGTVILTTADPNAAPAVPGQWVTVDAHLCPAADAPPDGDPHTVPPTRIGILWAVARAHDPATGEITLTLEDLVTLLGARVLQAGGKAGYLPAARTVQGVIRELVDVFGPAFATVPTNTAPNPAWAPVVDERDTGQLVPLTGSVWAAIEDMCDLAGLSAAADGPRLTLTAAATQPAHSGATITFTPAVPGIQGLPGSRRTVNPAPTRVIAVAQDPAGGTVTGIAADDAAAAAQGFHVDELLTVSAQSDTGSLQAVAVTRLAASRAAGDAGTARIPWLPHWRPGDLVTVAWTPTDMKTFYVNAVAIPLNPADPVTLTLRGPALPRWQDEPAGQTWAQLPPPLTWAADI